MTHFLFDPLLPHSLWLFLDLEEEEDLALFADLTHFARFTTDPDFCYQEFARREDDHFQVFRVQVRFVCDWRYLLAQRVPDEASSLLSSSYLLISPSKKIGQFHSVILLILRCLMIYFKPIYIFPRNTFAYIDFSFI